MVDNTLMESEEDITNEEPINETVITEEEIATPAEAEPTPAPHDNDTIVISKSLLTNVMVASIFLLLGFVLGGLFGTGILVNNSDAVMSAIGGGTVRNTTTTTTASNQPQPTQPPAVIDNVNEDDDPTYGPADAPVTIVEFSDFQCGFCGRFHLETLPLILENYEGQIRVVYRDFISVGGIKEAMAAECADDQDAFLAFHNQLFDNQGAYSSNEALIGLAGSMDLDVDTFTECLESEQYRSEVVADMQEGRGYGITGTPAFFINGIRVSGAQPYSVFEQVIEQALAEVDAN